MKQLLNAMRLQALMAGAGQASTRLGVVSSYNPNDYTVKVRLQPDDVETGWLPLLAPWVGNGWGMFSPPQPGDMVHVEFQEGSYEAGVACLRLFNDQDRPLPCPAGELWLVHASGASFRLTNDGAATFSDGHGATVRLNGNGTITSSGAWSHTGGLTVAGGLTVDSIPFGTHRHGGVNTGSGTSGGPTA